MKKHNRVYTVHESVQSPVAKFVQVGSYKYLADALRAYNRHPERLLRVTFKQDERMKKEGQSTVSTRGMVLIGFNHRYFIKACKIADVSINTVRRFLGKHARSSGAYHSHIRGI